MMSDGESYDYLYVQGEAASTSCFDRLCWRRGVSKHSAVEVR